MEVFYIGHAGFVVTHRDSVLVIDPWLSENGAFDRAWYQFPRNHHLRTDVGDKVKNAADVRIVLSHEHADHFCRDSLMDDGLRSAGIVIPDYRAKDFRDSVQALRDKPVVELLDRQRFRVGTLDVSFVIDDSGLDRDAGILVTSEEGSTFLNFNDCKAFDKLPAIREQIGIVDVFTCQFSGAIRHPVCYEYDRHHYMQVADEKRRRKFDTVRAAIESLAPRIFLPSAGPCAFLDPALFSLNFETRGGIFPKSWDFVEFLRRRTGDTQVEDLMPGDSLSISGPSVKTSKAASVVSAETYASYMQAYQHRCWRVKPAPRQRSQRLEECFIADLTEKLRIYSRNARHIGVAQSLYFQTSDMEPYFKVDFHRDEVSRTQQIDETNFFIHKLSWEEIAALYEDGLGWGGHALTFRFSIHREPDVYDRVIDLFLTSTVAEFRDGLQYLDTIPLAAETINIEAADGRRFRIKRFCPHQGADLLCARIEGHTVICPRHGWQFDLENRGISHDHGCDIAAEAI